MPRRFLYLALGAWVLFPSPAARAQTTDNEDLLAAAKGDPAYSLIEDALQFVELHDLDGALKKLNEAIKLNPRSTSALVLRGCVYGAQKQWLPAEEDFKAASFISPDDIQVKLLLADVKFSEKEYNAARMLYAALISDPDWGDLAAYRVLLCDMASGHDAAAAKEFAAFNQAGENPSYYFSNAAWSLSHKKIEDAKGWLDSAGRIYPQKKNAAYAQGLVDLGYLPLPPSGK